ncbi:SRPBCC domain-containing protein [Dictyobacter kobayashii]|uniref:Activator of HSP90 ATPase n=1 Tax=Dictyobacter kobayashii TaxID=2014872 RepID=A0A402ACZ5_9CHLR|nr:SRPBCC domain-containing protein [Dictyobacter kobayashii]GCE16979.1 activator of HSP90 ATPase [Dictyobacter kobayashii]
MPTIVIERSIAATPGSVFDALTQQDGIARWWTNDLTVKPEVGSLAEFRFTRWGAGILQFEIAELDAGAKVHWFSRKGPPQWAGTSVTWQITPIQDGTKIVFTHDGFAQVDAVYEQTRGNWEYFLDSLKSFLETGKGTPGLPVFF